MPYASTIEFNIFGSRRQLLASISFGVHSIQMLFLAGLIKNDAASLFKKFVLALE